MADTFRCPCGAISALDAAIDLAEDAISYVPNYFREKWNMDEQLAAVKASRKELNNDPPRTP